MIMQGHERVDGGVRKRLTIILSNIHHRMTPFQHPPTIAQAFSEEWFPSIQYSFRPTSKFVTMISNGSLLTQIFERKVNLRDLVVSPLALSNKQAS